MQDVKMYIIIIIKKFASAFLKSSIFYETSVLGLPLNSISFSKTRICSFSIESVQIYLVQLTFAYLHLHKRRQKRLYAAILKFYARLIHKGTSALLALQLLPPLCPALVLYHSYFAFSFRCMCVQSQGWEFQYGRRRSDIGCVC